MKKGLLLGWVVGLMFFVGDCFSQKAPEKAREKPPEKPPEKIAVCYGGLLREGKGLRGAPGVGLERYGIKPYVCHTSDDADIGKAIAGTDMTVSSWKEKYKDYYNPVGKSTAAIAAFLSHLDKAMFLYVSEFCEDLDLFNCPARQEAIKKFLRKGGVLYFDYWSVLPITFLASIGVEAPVHHAVRNYEAIISPDPKDREHPLLNKPYKIEDTKGIWGHHFWTSWSDKQKALLRSKDHPERAGLIVQDNVLEKGTVIFSRVLISRARSLPTPNPDEQLVMNILSLAYKTDIKK